MAQEAELKHGPTGVVPVGEGWFVLNARDARWHHAPGRSAVCEFEGESPFAQLGINLSVLRPGQAMSQYHWEADQEDFLVLAGQGVLIIEGEERSLRAWDLIHCPAGVSHVILGAGTNPCVVMAVGARDHSTVPDWEHIRSTLPPCDTAPGSGEKRLSRRKPTRGCLGESRWHSTLTGCPSQRSELLFRCVALAATKLWLPLRPPTAAVWSAAHSPADAPGCS